MRNRGTYGALVLALLALSAGCGGDAAIGNLSVEICADLLPTTSGVELIVSRPEGFASELPPGATLENVDGIAGDELVWPIPEPSGGWTRTLAVSIDNASGGESIAVRVAYGGGMLATSESRALSAGLTLSVCLPSQDAGVDDDAGLMVDAGPMNDDIRVTNAAGDSTLPSLVSTDTGLAVAWVDNRDGNSEIYLALLSSDGNPISEIRVTNDSASSEAPSLVWTGSEFGLAWHDDRDGNSEIYFVRISAAGVLIGSPTRVSDDAALSIYPSLVHNGSGYAIAWEDNRDGFFQIYFTRLGATGVEIGSALRLTQTTDVAAAASLAWTGSEYGLAWHDRRDSDEEIYFVRLDGVGSKLIADERVTAASGLSLIPSLVWTGSGFGIAWEDARDGLLAIFFVRMTASGDKLSTEIAITSPSFSSRSVDLEWTGSDFALAWNDSRNGPPEIYATRIDSSGTPIGPAEGLLDSGAMALAPSLAQSGAATSIAWQDDRDGNLEIYLQATLP